MSIDPDMLKDSHQKRERNAKAYKRLLAEFKKHKKDAAPVQATAAALGVAPRTVQRWLRANGIGPLPPGERPKKTGRAKK